MQPLAKSMFRTPDLTQDETSHQFRAKLRSDAADVEWNMFAKDLKERARQRAAAGEAKPMQAKTKEAADVEWNKDLKERAKKRPAAAEAKPMQAKTKAKAKAKTSSDGKKPQKKASSDGKKPQKKII